MRPNKATHSKLSLWTITLTSQNVELQLARQYLIHFLLKKKRPKKQPFCPSKLTSVLFLSQQSFYALHCVTTIKEVIILTLQFSVTTIRTLNRYIQYITQLKHIHTCTYRPTPYPQKGQAEPHCASFQSGSPDRRNLDVTSGENIAVIAFPR